MAYARVFAIHGENPSGEDSLDCDARRSQMIKKASPLLGSHSLAIFVVY
jgi:hypothetical protein